MNCIYCETQLPSKGFFCPNCFKQIKCKQCGELLMKDVKICIYCGEEVGHKIASDINTIEFLETETERKFKASFSDTVGQSITDSFGMILSNKIGLKKHLSTSLPFTNTNTQQSEITDDDIEVINDLSVNISPDQSKEELPNLEDVKLRDLAKSETEWILVYSYFASQKGTNVFTKDNMSPLRKVRVDNCLIII